MEEITQVIFYFIVYSFLGWVLESVYKSILQKKLVNSGFLTGPFCPIYGYGALIMYFSLREVTDNIVVLFLFGMFVLSLFEYVVGWFLEVAFKTKYWDYSNSKFNIKGRVCLLNSFYWGILGIIFMKFIHPFVEECVGNVQDVYIAMFTAMCSIYILIDTIMTTVKLVKINVRLKNWEQITEDIKNKFENLYAGRTIRLNNINLFKMESKYTVLRKFVEVKKRDAKLLEELKLKQQEVQEKLEKRMKRLRHAFPTMNSDRLSKFLNNSKKS